MNLLQRIRKLLNWEIAAKPDPKLLPEVYPHLKHFRLPLILTVLVMLIGTIGYVLIEDFPIFDAIYQTAITFTTVGFGELYPLSDVGKIFTINLIIAGFAVFSSAIGILVSELNKGHIVAIMKERRMLYKIVRLKKHFVVCYHNEYTIEVTKQLRRNHVPFVVIDPRPEIHEWALEHKYPHFLQAEPHAEVSMLKAHLSSAQGLITLSSSIADNIALIASVRLFEKEHDLPRPYYVISSAETESDVEKLKKLGSDTVVSPTKLTAQRVSAMAARPDMENLIEEFLYKNDNPLDMREIEVPKYSWAVLKKLKETHIRQMTNTSVIGIRKKDGKFISMPKGDVLVTSECKLLVIGTQAGIRTTRDLIRKREKPKELKFV
ncbi:TrkA family potassium uptake protein [Sulfurimonas sp.]|jgi:voltage-gated potassium channel|uniref:potassium channel family protein n=1 Tax=Sulfurimonas sp. TaxID=2022749 RepID=UPI0025EDCD04|nr:potassium channel protein [Sulfurimonas sp.]MBT5934526.1 potassium channel protein [Sulfurimonas sp.]